MAKIDQSTKEAEFRKAEKDALQEIKPKRKKETHMSTKKTIILTISSTLIFIAMLATMFVLGINYKTNQVNQIDAAVQARVDQLKPKQ